MGMERLILLVQEINPAFVAERTVADVYLASFGEGSQQAALILAEQVRDTLPQLRLMMNHGGGTLRSNWGVRINKVPKLH